MFGRSSLILLLCTVFSLITVMLIPVTRSVAVSLFLSEFEILKPTSESDKIERMALRHPDDIDAQIASILYSGVHAEIGKANTTSPVEIVPELERLLVKRPDYVPLYAILLRSMMLKEVKVHRKEEDLLSHKPPDATAEVTIDKESLRKFNRLAAEGERLDKGNAYFPAMRFAGMIAAHRDAEALAALHLAASSSHWNSYSSVPIRAGVKLQSEDPLRGPGCFQLNPLMASQYPQYSALRAAARTSTYFATEREKTGQYESGISIRKDAAKMGSLLRKDDTVSIGELVGFAIVLVAGTEPGGKHITQEEQKLPRKRSSRCALNC